jgi:hypothetical protein
MPDIGRALGAIKLMRSGFGKPPIGADGLLLKMEAQGLTETADVLRPYLELL